MSSVSSAQVVCSTPPAFDTALVARVTLTLSAPDITERSFVLGGHVSSWRATLEELPPGANRTFVASAYSADDTLLFQGRASDVTLTAGQTTQVSITLLRVTGGVNKPPVITRTSQSAVSVTGGESVTFVVEAHDPQGSVLSFSWQASAGGSYSDSSTYISQANWRAPDCVPKGTTPPTVTATVTNALGLSVSASFSVTVSKTCFVPPVVSMAAGRVHSLALDRDGTLWAWGGNAYGQLGDGSGPDFDLRHLNPTQVLTHVSSIAAGAYHTLAIKQDGTLWAWGHNGDGQLGDGSTTDRLTPVQVLSGVSAVFAGDSHTLALKQDGTLWGWGRNAYGQLGDSTPTDRPTPVQLATQVSTLTAGYFHSQVLKQDGTLLSWGRGGSDGIGDGSTLTGISALAAGHQYSLALKQDGTLWAWGNNDRGKLGDGSTTYRPTPVQILTSVSAMAARDQHTLALKQDGTLWAWGGNFYGALGDGSTTRRTTPVQVFTQVSALAVGYNHTLALTQDGALWAWGHNSEGQLGDGTIADRTTPVRVQWP
ncbi:RCC1 repeat-containing protein [Archangium minus]|uniref:RCC1 repeat-containing protein n=1 Tax=Archangium minus TaxID=83450 RepID=A0ABY9WQ86_9BACT|nr:RCC1 repeat-containing protein [Archangium minus]